MNDKTDNYNVTAEADQAHDDQWLAAEALRLLGHPAQALSDAAAGRYVREWSVAGALMEKVGGCLCESLTNGEWEVEAQNLDCMTEVATNESLSRAITEACVKALS